MRKKKVSSYLLVIMLIDVLACLGFQFLSIFLFYYFNNFLLLVLLSAIDYLWLFLRKRCFVKFENQSLFDCKLTRHHIRQRIKCIEEINDCHKKSTSQNPWSTCIKDQFMSSLISWIFGFTFSLYHSNMRDKQEGKVCRWSGKHSFLQKYFWLPSHFFLCL